MIKYFVLVPLIFATAFTLNLKAQIFSQGFDLLQVSQDARTLAMGDAGTALNNGPTAMYQNPANLMFSNLDQVQASYHAWIQDITYQHIGALFVNEKQRIGLSVYANAISDIEVRNRPGPATGTFDVNYLIISGAYAREIYGLNVGATVSFLNEQYLTDNARGYAVGAGISTPIIGRKKLVGGIAVNHMGQMQQLNALRTALPSNIRAGLRSEVIKMNLTSGDGKDLPLTLMLTADLVRSLQQNDNPLLFGEEDDEQFVNIGSEIKLGSYISVRAGYKSWDAARKWSYGIGLSLTDVEVDIAQIPFRDGFGNALSATLRYFF